MPQDLASLEWTDPDGLVRVGVTDAEYRAVPDWVKAYIVGNDAQWAEECLLP